MKIVISDINLIVKNVNFEQKEKKNKKIFKYLFFLSECHNFTNYETFLCMLCKYFITLLLFVGPNRDFDYFFV